MARAAFFTDAAGSLAGLFRSTDQPPTTIPSDARYVVEFDPDTNAGLIAQYGADSNAFAIAGNTLTVNGVVATINPGSAVYEAEARLPGVVSKLQNTTDPLTREELADVLTVLLRDSGRL